MKVSKKGSAIVLVGFPILWGAGLFIFMNTTSPLQNGPLSVLFVFTLFYLLLVSSLYCFALLTIKLINFLGARIQINKRKLYYLMSVLSFGPVFLLALNTLGQLELKEVLLIAALVIVGSFYVARRSQGEII